MDKKKSKTASRKILSRIRALVRQAKTQEEVRAIEQDVRMCGLDEDLTSADLDAAKHAMYCKAARICEAAIKEAQLDHHKTLAKLLG